MCCLYVGLQHIVRFLDNSKMLDFMGFYFWKMKSLNFGGQNRKFRSLQTFAAFLSKIAEHDVTKTPFSQNFLDGFSWNFAKRCQIMTDKVLKLRVDSCCRFWAIEKIREGVIFPPPPSASRVNCSVPYIYFTLFLSQCVSEIRSSFKSMNLIPPNSSFSLPSKHNRT